MENNQYSTLSEATTDMKRRGYTHEFNVNDDIRLMATDLDAARTYASQDVRVVEFHRFEGESDPGDMTIVYGLETHDGERGVLIDAYGANSEDKVDDFVKGLEIEH